jgi:hypothetical protein
MKTYTFNLEGKIGTVDTITVAANKKSEAKQIAKEKLKKNFKSNFPLGNFSILYIL